MTDSSTGSTTQQTSQTLSVQIASSSTCVVTKNPSAYLQNTGTTTTVKVIPF